METSSAVEINSEDRFEETAVGAIRSPSTSPKQITDPVIYKLVRVEGDGRLVPATDDEVMEVEDLLEDEKSEPPLIIEDPSHTEGCLSSEGLSSKADFESSEGLPKSESTGVDTRKLNAKREYIEVMLQKVKQEEKLRLSCGSPDSKQMNIDGLSCDQTEQVPSTDEKLLIENPLQEAVPLLSPRLSDSTNTQIDNVETCSKPTEEPIVIGSSVSDICTSSKPDFSIIKGDICLDNMSIRELHEAFRATFGRETSAKDKLWLKRRIAMGLTNSCDVSTTSFIIKDKTLVRDKVSEEAHCKMENSMHVDGSLPSDQIIGSMNYNCRDSPTSPTNQVEEHVSGGKRLRKPKTESFTTSEDLHMEQTAAKRVRKPTRRYIEELSEVESRECSERFVSSVKISGNGHSSPNSRVRPFNNVVSDRTAVNVVSDRTAVVTRQDSFGGSGVRVPFVSRVRRSRPRENYMPLLKYGPGGMAAKLVKKALGVCVLRQDGESGSKLWKARALPKEIPQPIVADTETEKWDIATDLDEQQKALEPSKLDPSGDNAEDNIATVPTSKGGTRRKHHRAWTLCEVMKLVEGVSRYGAGRWSEIKRVAFASYNYRTSVDLKDKWRNLLRASFSQAPADKGVRNSQKHASMPIPAHILLRVRELAEMHSQTGYPQSSIKLPGRFSNNVHETRSGFL